MTTKSGTYTAVTAPGLSKCGRPAIEARDPEAARQRALVAAELDAFMRERGISNVEAANEWSISESIVRDMRIGRVELTVRRASQLRGGHELVARIMLALSRAA